MQVSVHKRYQNGHYNQILAERLRLVWENRAERPVLTLGKWGTLYGSTEKTKNIKFRMQVFVHRDDQNDHYDQIWAERLRLVWENRAERPVLTLGKLGTLYGSTDKTENIKFRMQVFVHRDDQNGNHNQIIAERLRLVWENRSERPVLTLCT